MRVGPKPPRDAVVCGVCACEGVGRARQLPRSPCPLLLSPPHCPGGLLPPSGLVLPGWVGQAVKFGDVFAVKFGDIHATVSVSRRCKRGRAGVQAGTGLNSRFCAVHH